MQAHTAGTPEPSFSSTHATPSNDKGLRFTRRFTRPDVHPFDEVTWVLRDAIITGADGKVYFEQRQVEFPEAWSQTAVNVVAQKYFRGTLGSATRERSVKQMLSRVADTIAGWGRQGGYFATAEDEAAFHAELIHLMLHQKMAFNSPVWFNVGIQPEPAASACYINSVDDSMDSILTLAKTEGMLFKHGSGTGSNLSGLRSAGEDLRNGGTASGPVSFMRGFDAFAGAIKSGGSTRRAAKMVILNVDHPDVVEFIECKATEEKKAWALIDAGYDGSFNVAGGAYDSVGFQNANHSVRVSDDFMQAVLKDAAWSTRAVVDGRVVQTFKAKDILHKMAEAAWVCGDPGIQFDTTINAWHTCPAAGRINASNPCSEYMFLDDTACNLASINLRKFQDDRGSFDTAGFETACALTITAMEILVGNASYPTPKITRNSHDFRPLGLGYANLGALLMSRGLAYDSDEGRSYAAAITSLMCAAAYAQSAQIAHVLGPFKGHAPSAGAMLDVVEKHADANHRMVTDHTPGDARDIAVAATSVWSAAITAGIKYGFRNSQVTVLAPTGTIAFLMDCDTTGVEPDLALVKYKRLVGGGTLKIVNQTVPEALTRLGYADRAVMAITAYIADKDTIEGAPYLKPAHLPVFDCAFRSNNSTRSIHYLGHLRMMAAVQPFLSGAISKCVTGDTVITTTQGLRRIASYFKSEAPDTFRELTGLNVPVAGGGTTTARSFYYGGVKPTWRATLADGRVLTGTAPHRVRVANADGLDWALVKDLAPGQFVALLRGTDLWGAGEVPTAMLSAAHGSQHREFKLPTSPSFDLGLFLGMLTADGHVAQSNYTVSLTKNCEAVLTTFTRLLADLFGLPAHRDIDARNGVQSVRVGSKALLEWLNAIGFSKRHMPDFVLAGPREMARGFLSGLWLDGYITKLGDVAIGQKHKGLLLDVQSVWDNLGVPTYFTDNVINDINYPVLHIMASHRRRAADLIQWLEPHKADRARDLTAGSDKSQPFPMHRAALCKAIHAAGRTQEFRTALDPRTHQLAKSTFLRVADAIGFQLTAEERAYDYVPVIAVEYAGEQEVFDLSVPATEMFVGNGIVNHNTVNLPTDCTVTDIEDAYTQAWKMGLKAIAVYRDGCKRTQPLSTTAEASLATPSAAATTAPTTDGPPPPRRHKLTRDRHSMTHKFAIGGHEGYITVGLYADGTPGEIFVRMAKEGSTIAGLVDSFATAVSIALQHGAPLTLLVDKFKGTRFEPSGFTGNADIPLATSIMDYVFRWLEQFAARRLAAPTPVPVSLTTPPPTQPATPWVAATDAPPCHECGTLMVRNGACHKCPNCGSTSGCS